MSNFISIHDIYFIYHKWILEYSIYLKMPIYLHSTNELSCKKIFINQIELLKFPTAFFL